MNHERCHHTGFGMSMQISSVGGILSLVSLDELVDPGVDLSLEGGGVEGEVRLHQPLFGFLAELL